MKNRWILNLVLLGVIAALSLLLLFKPGQEDKNTQLTLTSIKPDDIKNIQLVRRNRKIVELVKTDKRWHMKQPIKARANRFNVSNLIRLATVRVDSRFQARKEELQQFGLDNPETVVWLDDVKLEVGQAHPLNKQRYLKRGQFIYLVPVSGLRIIDHPFADFLSHRLLEDNISLSGLDLPHFKLRLESGSWVVMPKKKGVTSDQMNNLVQEWKHASALTVDRYLGRPVNSWVTLHFADEKKTLRLGILRQKPELVLYRKDEGLEYRFPEEVGKRLLRLEPAK